MAKKFTIDDLEKLISFIHKPKRLSDLFENKKNKKRNEEKSFEYTCDRIERGYAGKNSSDVTKFHGKCNNCGCYYFIFLDDNDTDISEKNCKLCNRKIGPCCTHCEEYYGRIKRNGIAYPYAACSECVDYCGFREADVFYCFSCYLKNPNLECTEDEETNHSLKLFASDEFISKVIKIQQFFRKQSNKNPTIFNKNPTIFKKQNELISLIMKAANNEEELMKILYH